MDRTAEGNWLLLIHRIPPSPAYFRVKIWRRLQGLGSVAIKNSVYVLPRTAQTTEDFQWVVREIVQGGGEASLCEAQFVDGLTDQEVRALFQEARGAEYAELAREARAAQEALAAGGEGGKRENDGAALARLRKRLHEIAALDFFGAPGRETAEGAVAALESALRPAGRAEAGPEAARRRADLLEGAEGRTWVTRRDVHVDRMASAWLIRRFIDPDARFRFVSSNIHSPGPGEIRFDMFEAEFTHEGDLCTFEVLLEGAGLDDPALRTIAEIVHDIDMKDGKFGREEAPGLARLFDGIALSQAGDEDRLKNAAAALDGLYAYFKGKPIAP
ncbi:MAG: chromate resistance protein [Candidatus Tectomicrobia bacterium]|uniref:Chromate resistance protein n=1 Tax=Tectimicrobiota bacterium TaxID=2528274 RepID=A0A932HWS0_UNCTE|nr:chromate resistance protein [Candidatus Tectomicrobia bacterium]